MALEEILAGESKNLESKVQCPKVSSKYMKTVVAFAKSLNGPVLDLTGMPRKPQILLSTS
ncbi:MAG: hypothetical protein LKE61_06635 [Erysipelotrichaceae bacterium]|jgi:predicted HTH transcriptional regulator|nr:hypothetical protein [Erysipelotrichaceae bacterium]MCI1326351.1 hypothetical protein [Solobacterium sp.]MCH4044469.1 hypothetical protein [Erysipelotrichaceae bacterium]MCH4121681.1 hypothetical protein [Erysipelotrichaceae bacterium]MCI1362942.1 hypothetical protein [Solobacterium sp.]